MVVTKAKANYRNQRDHHACMLTPMPRYNTLTMLNNQSQSLHSVRIMVIIRGMIAFLWPGLQLVLLCKRCTWMLSSYGMFPPNGWLDLVGIPWCHGQLQDLLPIHDGDVLHWRGLCHGPWVDRIWPNAVIAISYSNIRFVYFSSAHSWCGNYGGESCGRVVGLMSMRQQRTGVQLDPRCWCGFDRRFK